MALLEYENQIFLDAFQEDGLLVMAKYLQLFSYMVIDYETIVLSIIVVVQKV